MARRDATTLVADVHRQVQLIRDALSGAPRASDDADVTGVLAFFDGDWTFFPPHRNKGVWLEVRDPRPSSSPAKGPTP